MFFEWGEGAERGETRCMLRTIIVTVDEGGGGGASKVKDES